MFVLQAILLVAVETIHKPTSGPTNRAIEVSGLSIAVIALVGLPLVERLLGLPWSQTEVFGLFPDATAVFTLGILLARADPGWPLFIVPVLWCGIGSATLSALKSPDAPIGVVAAVVTVALLVWKAIERRRLVGDET